MNFDNIKKKQTVGLNALKEYFDMLWDSYVMENNENLTEGAKDLKLEVLRCVLYLVEYPYKTQQRMLYQHPYHVFSQEKKLKLYSGNYSIFKIFNFDTFLKNIFTKGLIGSLLRCYTKKYQYRCSF